MNIALRRFLHNHENVATYTYDKPYTLNNIGSVEGTLQYFYYATPGEPLQGSPGVA